MYTLLQDLFQCVTIVLLSEAISFSLECCTLSRKKSQE